MKACIHSNTLYVVNLNNLPKQQIRVKTWKFTKTRLGHSMEIKTGSGTDSIIAIYSKDLTIY